MNNIQLIADELTNRYPWRRWDFGLGSDWQSQTKFPSWVWRHLVKTSLVANSTEKAAFIAIVPIFNQYPEAQALGEGNWREITDILDESGVEHPGNKAKYIIEASRRIHTEFDDLVPTEREALESLPGVGRHIASVIRATCYGEEEFAVDIHVKRIAKRLLLVEDPNASPLEVERAIQASCTAEQWGHFSRSFVDFGQTVCGYRPNCEICLLASKCPSCKRVK